MELQACSDCINVIIYLLSQSWQYTTVGKKAMPNNSIHVPQNLFMAATRCSYIELSFYKSHYNSVVPIEVPIKSVVPPPVIMVRQ